MKTKGLKKLGGIISEAIVPNVVIMTDAILEELKAAETQNRRPSNLERDCHLQNSIEG